MDLVSNGNIDVFLAKADTSGNLEWVIRGGSLGEDAPINMQIDSSGTYLSGFFNNTATFISTSGNEFEIVSNGATDVFLAKANTSGDWEWVISGGGDSSNNNDLPVNMQIDSSGAYLSGIYRNTATFTSASGNILTLTGGINQKVFLAKSNTLGEWEWVINAFHNTSNNVIPVDMQIDSSGVYINGFFGGKPLIFRSPNSLITVNLNGSNVSNTDVFLAKANLTGDWEWAISGGSTSVGNDQPVNMQIDSSSVYISGFIGGTSAIFNFVNGPITLNLAGNSVGNVDVFLARINKEQLKILEYLGVAHNTVAPNQLVNNCFKSGEIIDGFNNLIAGSQYYIDDNRNLTTTPSSIEYGLALTENKMLVDYNGPKGPLGPAGKPLSLDDLNNVHLNDVKNNQVLQYNNNNWINTYINADLTYKVLYSFEAQDIILGISNYVLFKISEGDNSIFTEADNSTIRFTDGGVYRLDMSFSFGREIDISVLYDVTSIIESRFRNNVYYTVDISPLPVRFILKKNNNIVYINGFYFNNLESRKRVHFNYIIQLNNNDTINIELKTDNYVYVKRLSLQSLPWATNIPTAEIIIQKIR